LDFLHYLYLQKVFKPFDFSAWHEEGEEGHRRVGHGVEGDGQVVDGVAIRHARKRLGSILRISYGRKNRSIFKYYN
jgi:hypothetical protein